MWVSKETIQAAVKDGMQEAYYNLTEQFNTYYKIESKVYFRKEYNRKPILEPVGFFSKEDEIKYSEVKYETEEIHIPVERHTIYEYKEYIRKEFGTGKIVEHTVDRLEPFIASFDSLEEAQYFAKKNNYKIYVYK